MRYTKAIIIYGVVIPCVIMGIIGAAILGGYKAFSAKAAAKENRWNEHKERVVKCDAMEAKLEPNRSKVAFQKDLLSRDIQGTLSEFLDEQLSGASGSKLIRQSLDFPPAVSVDAATDSSFRRVEIGFLGRFDGMQSLALETETRFPQLSLASYSIQNARPTAAVPSQHLLFKTSFKAYTEEKK